MSNKVMAFFPGQGSQNVGMGADLTQKSSRFSEADEALGYKISDLCFKGPIEELTLTANVQPAILTHSVACYDFLEKHIEITVAAGHSLGEYSALVAAKVINFQDAVQLVHKRGSYMQTAVPVGEGKMLVILGQEVSAIEEALFGNTAVQIANINAPGQIVISGSAEGIDQFQADNGTFKMKELPVSAPFHSELMKPAAENLAPDIDATEFNDSAFPVMSNFLAKPLSKADDFKQALKDQVAGKVRWVECVENATSEFDIDTVIEFGPGRVLTGLMKRINKSIKTYNIQTWEDVENYLSESGK